MCAYCATRDWKIVADYVEPGASATDDRRRKACSCVRSSLPQAQNRQCLECPVLYRNGAPEEIRTPDP